MSKPGPASAGDALEKQHSNIRRITLERLNKDIETQKELLRTEEFKSDLEEAEAYYHMGFLLKGRFFITNLE